MNKRIPILSLYFIVAMCLVTLPQSTRAASDQIMDCSDSSTCSLGAPTSLFQSADKTPEQLVQEAKKVIKEVSITEAKKMMDSGQKLIILDVREKDEYDSGHIPGAILMPRGFLEFKVQTIIPDKSATVIVYCMLDLRGPLATKTMNELGYKNTVNIAGGLKAWKDAGYPVMKQ
ncbi:MAG: rhodanese-like domain-containing protein [Dissulfurispiraceae bacterium]